MRATAEQEEAVALFRKKSSLKITAFAGAGKTSSLRLLAEANRKRGVYLAFNKKIAAEAKDKFPGNVDCRTTHSMAWRAIRDTYPASGKLGKSLFPKQLAEERGYKKQVFGEKLCLDSTQQAFLVLKTITNFCQSSTPELQAKHVPNYGALIGQSRDVLADVREWCQKEALSLWREMTNPRSKLPLSHDGYLKVWALDEPLIAASYILLDEAQDSNPVVLDVLQKQQAQLVYVGDRHQQIYEWRGAVNAMQQIATDEEAYLTKSFRFGSALASEASKVLRHLGETKNITGNEAIITKIEPMGRADAILARTNATVIAEVVDALGRGEDPFIVGGTDELKRLVSDVYELKKKKPGKSPEFFGFTSWAEVVHFSQTEEGESLLGFVQLVDKHGENKLWKAVTSVAEDEADADTIISTAHKGKGCEWPRVRLAGDFLSSRPATDRKSAEAEVRLFYVAMTRAQNELIVDPELLQMYTTGAWKNQQAAPKHPARTVEGSAASKVIEINAYHVQQSHPSAPRFEEPKRSPALTPRPAIQIERVNRNAQQQHPAAAPSSPPARNIGLRPAPPKRRTWGQRLASLFGVD